MLRPIGTERAPYMLTIFRLERSLIPVLRFRVRTTACHWDSETDSQPWSPTLSRSHFVDSEPSRRRYCSIQQFMVVALIEMIAIMMKTTIEFSSLRTRHRHSATPTQAASRSTSPRAACTAAVMLLVFTISWSTSHLLQAIATRSSTNRAGACGVVVTVLLRLPAVLLL